MPLIRSLVSARYVLLTTLISLNSEIISPYSCCVKKGLVYIIITASSSYQPSFCLKYTKANICSSYDIHLVSDNKYIFSISWYYEYLFSPSQFLGGKTW